MGMADLQWHLKRHFDLQVNPTGSTVHPDCPERILMMLSPLWVVAYVVADIFLPLSHSTFPGSGASATAWLRDCRLLWRRRGLIPVQRVRPEEGTEEDKSARIQFKQDKARAAGLGTSWTIGGARLFCGSQTLNAAELCGLSFSSFPCWCFCFLNLRTI